MAEITIARLHNSIIKIANKLSLASHSMFSGSSSISGSSSDDTLCNDVELRFYSSSSRIDRKHFYNFEFETLPSDRFINASQKDAAIVIFFLGRDTFHLRSYIHIPSTLNLTVGYCSNSAGR